MRREAHPTAARRRPHGSGRRLEGHGRNPAPPLDVSIASSRGGADIPYQIEKSDHDVIDAVRRIGANQVERAIASIDAEGELEPRVHDVRKRLKKMRGLIRLVRPVFPDYKMENAHFRDTQRSISGLRDAQVLGQTLDDLIANHEEPLDPEAFAEFRHRINEAAHEAPAEIDLAPVRESLERARERIDAWTLHDTGWDAVAGGLKKTYQRARKRQSATTDRELHDWRKRLKYHWYHVRLLRDIWREEMEAREAAADKISDDMGLYQDLVVLEAEVEKGPLNEESARVLRGLIEARKAEKLAAARDVADRLLADKPKVLVARWGELWEAWRT